MEIRLTRKQIVGLLFVSPGVVYLLVFFLYPFFYTIFLSLHYYPLTAPPKYIGLDNFVHLFTKDAIFLESAFATFYYMVTYCIGIWFFSLVFSLFFTSRFRGRSIYVVAFIASSMIGMVQQSLVWKILLHPNFGIFNYLFFYSWGYPERLNWLTNMNLVMPGMILSTLIGGIPFFSMYLLSGLGGIPTSYYEVAKLMGASPFQRFRYVTFPSIKPIYIYVVITSLIMSFRQFTPFFIMTGGGPLNLTRVISLYTYNTAFNYYNFGYAAAIVVVLLVPLSICCFAALKYMSR